MQFVDVANQFQSQITVHKGGEEPGEADGKSVMQMIILAATEGTPMRIDADGEDAEDGGRKAGASCSRTSSVKKSEESDECSESDEVMNFDSSILHLITSSLRLNGDQKGHRRFARRGDRHGDRAGRRGSAHSRAAGRGQTRFPHEVERLENAHRRKAPPSCHAAAR